MKSKSFEAVSKIPFLMFSRLVSIPPVAPSISTNSIPAILAIPLISPVSAIQTGFKPYFSPKGCTLGTAPAPLGIIMLAGGSPEFILIKFNGWSLSSS